MPATELIVGLGNPGRQYQNTRHNVGFRCLELLARRWGMKFARQRGRAEIAEGEAVGTSVILAKPQTFMNSSGESVRALMKMSNLTPSQLLVVYDDLDLPFGKTRLRERGSAGGHRGIQSIIENLGTQDFVRIKIGIGRPPDGVDPIDYVLSDFTASERADLEVLFERVAKGIETLLEGGAAAAMNEINVG